MIFFFKLTSLVELFAVEHLAPVLLDPTMKRSQASCEISSHLRQSSFRKCFISFSESKEASVSSEHPDMSSSTSLSPSAAIPESVTEPQLEMLSFSKNFKLCPIKRSVSSVISVPEVKKKVNCRSG